MSETTVVKKAAPVSALLERERAVLASVMELNGDTPPILLRLLDHAPESFDDLICGRIAVEMSRLKKRKEPIHQVTLMKALKGSNIQGIALALYSLGDNALPKAIAELEGKDCWHRYQQRRLKSIGVELCESVIKGHDVQGLMDHARIAFDSLDDDGKAKYDLHKRRRFDPLVEIPEPESVFRLAGTTICTPGNITSLHAQAKAGKTAVIGGTIGAVMRDPSMEDCDCLGFTASNPDGKAVIHIDTEQTEGDHAKLVRAAMRRARVDEPPKWLYSYWLKGMGAEQIKKALHDLVTNAAGECGGVHSILVDGAADLVSDVNDARECNALVTFFESMACDYECPLIGVIHFNPGGVKVRGHLGSQLERKAESNLTIEKNGEISVIFSEKQRGAPILKSNGPSFTWSDSRGMHISCEGMGDVKLKQKLSDERFEASQAFGDRPAMTYTNLVKSTAVMFGIKERASQDRITKWRRSGVVVETHGKLLELAPYDES